MNETAIRRAGRVGMLGRFSALGGELWLVGALLLLWGLWVNGAPLGNGRSFALGSTDRNTALGFELAETTDAGRSFRWTSGDSTLVLAPEGAGAHTLQMTISGPRPDGRGVPLAISINERPVLQLVQPDSPRRYHFLVPASWLRMWQNQVRLQSDTFVPPQDSEGRSLGVVVFDAAWRSLEPMPWLVPAQVAAVALTAALLYALLLTAGIGLASRLLALALFLAITLAMRHSDPRFVYRWDALWLTLALAPPLALALPLVRRSSATTEARAAFRPWAALHWPALVGYTIATTVLFFPLIANINTQIIGSYGGDNFEYLWKMQWYSDALTQQHTSPVFAPQIFYPTGADLTISELTPGNGLLGLPLTWLFGHVVSYNLLMLNSFVLTGFCAYLLAHRLGARRGAAFVAGLIFAYSLRRYYHAPGHFGMMGTQWLALALYGWEGVLTRRRAWDGFVCGMGLAMASWCTLHYGSTLPLLLAAYAPIRLGLRRLPELVSLGRPLAVTAALFLTLVAPLAQPYVESQLRGDTFKHTYTQLILHSAAPIEYVLPNPYHPLWGAWASQFYRLTDGGEHTFGLGYTALALTLAALWFQRRNRIVWALVVVSLINVVMTLGPEWFLADGSSIKLPAYYLYRYVPVLGNIRVWSRMAMYVTLCVALLASLGLSALPSRVLRWSWMLAGSLVLAEMVSVFALSEVPHRPVDAWLRTQPGIGGVTEVPTGDRGASMYLTLATGKPTNQGGGKFLPSAYREGRNRLGGFPDDSSVRLLQRWQADYVIVDEGALAAENPGWREKAAAEPRLHEVYREGGYSVYRVRRTVDYVTIDR